MSKIKVAIVGVGNCAKSLVEGVQYYRDAPENESVPGLMNVNLGGYHIRDIEFVCAFDIDQRKVGLDLANAVNAEPNCSRQICEVEGPIGAPVYMGKPLDGLSTSMEGRADKRRFLVAEKEPVDVVEKLRQHEVDVMLLYLPVGSQKAVEFYCECALEAGVAVVNNLPVFIASDPMWAKRFEKAGVPILGDDIKSQVGATIVHRVLTRLFEDRGVHMDHTYQLNVGGNTDFLNMLDQSRLTSKKVSKTAAVTSQLDREIDPDDVHIGPSDYVPWLNDNKLCFMRLEGRGFGDIPLDVEVRMSVQDSPNSAGVVIDSLRCAKLALDRGLKGAITAPSSYFFKHPPIQYNDSECLARTRAYIAGLDEDAVAKGSDPVPIVTE